MQSYLFIGGPHDGLSFPVVDDIESVKLPVAVTDKAAYVRSTLSVGDVSVTIYLHSSLTPEQFGERRFLSSSAACSVELTVSQSRQLCASCASPTKTVETCRHFSAAPMSPPSRHPLPTTPQTRSRVIALLYRYFLKSPLLNISLISSGLSESSSSNSSASFISRIN